MVTPIMAKPPRQPPIKAPQGVESPEDGGGGTAVLEDDASVDEGSGNPSGEGASGGGTGGASFDDGGGTGAGVDGGGALHVTYGEVRWHVSELICMQAHSAAWVRACASSGGGWAENPDSLAAHHLTVGVQRVDGLKVILRQADTRLLQQGRHVA
eukprot:4214262-Prymnesium_polylepis.3